MTAVGVTEKASDGNDAGRRRQGCGARFVTTFNESMERQQQKQRRQNKADPWIVRKFAVGLCIALVAYCYYVFVGRACVPMIRQDPGNHGSRSAGIVLVVVFNILWLLMVYAYANIVLTPPGLAKNYVQKGPSPEPPLGYNRYQRAVDLPAQTIAGPPFQVMGRTATASATLSNTPVDGSLSSIADPERLSAGHPAAVSLAQSQLSRPSSSSTAVESDDNARAAKLIQGEQRSEEGLMLAKPAEDAIAEEEPSVGAAGTLPSSIVRAVQSNTATESHSAVPDAATEPAPLAVSASRRSYLNFPEPPMQAASAPLVPMPGKTLPQAQKLQREVPQSMPLHPYFRYCTRCEFVRPPRAHHCRHCNTCVLNLDHHCPWIGQCCGAQNHLHFVAFCFWSFVCLLFVGTALSILIAAPGVSPSPSLDGQMVAICAIAYFFAIFTASMTVTHVQLILMNESTIEQIAISDMRHREKAALQRELGVFAIKQKKTIVKQWDQEWGKPHTEGNLWWLESKQRNWKATMGPSPMRWLFPTPWYRPNDGLHYETNPRRGEDGQWRRREEWPKELQ